MRGRWYSQIELLCGSGTPVEDGAKSRYLGPAKWTLMAVGTGHMRRPPWYRVEAREDK